MGPTKNSPYSVFITLVMTHLGTRGLVALDMGSWTRTKNPLSNSPSTGILCTTLATVGEFLSPESLPSGLQLVSFTDKLSTSEAFGPSTLAPPSMSCAFASRTYFDFVPSALCLLEYIPPFSVSYHRFHAFRAMSSPLGFVSLVSFLSGYTLPPF